MNSIHGNTSSLADIHVHLLRSLLQICSTCYVHVYTAYLCIYPITITYVSVMCFFALSVVLR